MNQAKEANFISAVVYIHNRAAQTERFLTRLYERLAECFSRFEVICVDDASTDGAADRVRALAAGWKKGSVSLVRMSFHQGLELSMNAGIELSIGDFVFAFDHADEAAPLDRLMEAYRAALAGSDIVALTPRRGAVGASKLFYRLFNACARKPCALGTESFHIVSRRALNRCQAAGKTIPYRKAVYADCGLKILRLPFDGTASARRDGKDWDTAMAALLLFTNAAPRASGYITLFFTLACLFTIGYVLWVYASGHPVQGWTTTMLFLSLGFLSVAVLFGIVMQYLSVMTDMIFRNKTYVFEAVEKLNR